MVKSPGLHSFPERIALDLSPCEAAARCASLPGLVFFDTALEAPGEALSMVAAAPSQVFSGRTAADWALLRRALAAREPGGGETGGIPPGFAAGWVEYDGAFCFGFYDKLLAYRHAGRGSAGAWFSVGGAYPEWSGLLDQARPAEPPLPEVRFSSATPKEEFIRRVERAQEYIAAGHIYQVNLSHRFSAKWPGPEPGACLSLYTALRRCSPAPHAALLSLRGRTVLSSSPELFLEIRGRTIRTRPIKGTRPRRADRREDEKSARDLVTSPKENAELVMITDLERNDLGQVCEFGSVTVRDLLKLERFEQVFHLVSTVEGRLRPEVDAVTALRACFPGGSITGAPKKRAMEIIAELETVPRGLYTGALGYFGFNGESQFNIAIRTVIVEGGEAHFHVGSGIVADSKPAEEWQETLDKAAGILLAAREMRRAGVSRAKPAKPAKGRKAKHQGVPPF